jgi:hypothetical protein
MVEFIPSLMIMEAASLGGRPPRTGFSLDSCAWTFLSLDGLHVVRDCDVGDSGRYQWQTMLKIRKMRSQLRGMRFECIGGVPEPTIEPLRKRASSASFGVAVTVLTGRALIFGYRG